MSHEQFMSPGDDHQEFNGGDTGDFHLKITGSNGDAISSCSHGDFKLLGDGEQYLWFSG
jgi:hypothetical protein